jgi:PAS domain S-box-containing protein
MAPDTSLRPSPRPEAEADTRSRILVLAVSAEPTQGLRDLQKSHSVRTAFAHSWKPPGDPAPDLLICETPPEPDTLAGWINTIRQNRGTARVPILLLVRPGCEIAGMEGLKAGANDYLTMPVDKDELARRVSALLEVRQREPGRKTAALTDSPATLSPDLPAAPDQAPIAIFSKDPDGRYIHANPFALEMLGIKGDLQGQTDHDVLPPEVADSLRRHDVEVMTSGHPLQREEPLGDRMFLSSKFPLWDSAGEASGVCGVAIDITERARIAQQLLESEAKLKTLVDHAPVGIFVAASDGRLLTVNGHWCEMAGMEAEAALGLGWIEAVHPDDREQVVTVWSKAVAAGEASETDFRFLRPDGSIIWVHGSTARLETPKGEFAGLIGSCVDVTARKCQETALLESERRFRAIVSQAAVGVVQTDTSGRFQMVNQAWCEMLGYSEEEMLQLTIPEITHPDSLEETMRMVGRLLAGGPDFVIDKIYCRKDGTRMWATSNVSALHDTNGKIDSIVALVMDTTVRKEAEIQLAAMTERAERQRRLYDTILSNTPDLVYVLDAGHRFIYANHALLQTWGKSFEEAVGKTAAELGYEPWQVEIMDRDIREALRSGQPVRGEMTYEGTYGSRVYEYIFSPITGPEGQVEFVAGTTRDVTERARSEQLALFLSGLSGKLARIADEAGIIQTTIAAVGGFLNAQRCHFSEANPSAGLLTVKAEWKLDDAPSMVGTHSISRFGHEGWWAKASAGNFSVTDVGQDPLTCDHVAAYRPAAIASYACHSLGTESGSTFMIGVTASEPREWTPDELRLLENVIARVWPMVERARTVASLRESKQRLRLVSDNIPALISHSDRNLILRFANARYGEWFGNEREEIVGHHLGEIIGEKILEQRLPYINRTLAGETVRFEGTAKHQELGLRNLEISLVPDLDRDGSVQGFYAMAFDITERKRTEFTLQRQSKRLRLLWEAAGIIMTSDDPDTMLQRLFARIREHIEVDMYFNFMVEEDESCLILRSCQGFPQDAINEISRLEFGASVCGLAALRREAIVTTHIQSSDDPMVQLIKGYGIRSLACNPLMAGDQLLGTLSFASLTRDEFCPDELEFMETLSQHITGAYERHRLLTNLRELDRRKDQFLATLAHELRNPLAPILTGLEVMLRSIDDPEAITRVAAMMQRQTHQIVHLIDDLLDISRITTGKIVLKRAVTPLCEIFRSAVEAAQPLIEKFEHKLDHHEPDPLLDIEGDPHRIAQIISNLLSNAAKYTPTGGRISLRAELLSADTVSIIVSDNGLGIDHGLQKKIFNLFEQDDHGRNDGLGIGLTLVKSLVELHGGHVTVTSAGTGMGSEFAVELPGCSRRGNPESLPPTSSSGKNGSRKRVLVVDDGKSAADILALFFRLEGMEVEVAYDGQEALDLADEFEPDIVVMDLGMPRVDGFEAARRMRKDRPSVVLIALSGWGRDEDKQRSSEAGFNEHLIKPVSPEDLRKVLRKFGAVMTGSSRRK